ncbi:MAG TPA: hypothetical protein PK224_09650 [Nitrospira sp.]|nr:hypothetical protein [Nitrospira sp.]
MEFGDQSMRPSLLSAIFAFFILTGICAFTQSGFADEQPVSASHQPFQDWLIEKIDADPSEWDRLRDLILPISKRLAYDAHQKEVVILPYDIPDVVLRPMSADAREDPQLRPFIGAAGEPPRLRPFLSSGGMWNWVTLNPFLPGHYDVTLGVLNEEGMPWSFSSEAAEVVADASRDPDLFEWNCPAAHAQNPIASTVTSRFDFTRGKEGFFTWIKGRVNEIREAQVAGDDRLALYHLGRVLHSIQDLASHRGMDNAEHSWLDHQGEGPDEDTLINIPLAKTLTRDFLEHLSEISPSINYALLRNPRNALSTWGYKEVKDRLGFSRQLTKKEYDAFKKLGSQLPASLNGLTGVEFEVAVKQLKNRWFTPADWRKMISEIKEHSLKLPLSESVLTTCH